MRKSRTYALRSQGSGYAAEGHNFYVWDEDRRAAAQAAEGFEEAERRSGHSPQTPSPKPGPAASPSDGG